MLHELKLKLKFRMDTFSIYYYHGGRFDSVEDEVVYVGGEIYPRHGLDADRIGFQPHGLKFKGKNAITSKHLENERATLEIQKRMSAQARSTEMAICQSQNSVIGITALAPPPGHIEKGKIAV